MVMPFYNDRRPRSGPERREDSVKGRNASLEIHYGPASARLELVKCFARPALRLERIKWKLLLESPRPPVI